MTTVRFGFDEIGASTSGVHALHDSFVQHVEDLLGGVLEIDVIDGTPTYTPTAAQAEQWGIFKFSDDASTPPASDTRTLLDLTNFPDRAFAVWNNTTDTVVTFSNATLASNMGMGVLPGDVGMFYFDGTNLHSMSVTDNDMSIIEVRAVDVLASVGGSHTGVFSGESFGGVTLAFGDWVLLTDYRGPFLVPAATADAKGFHPKCGDVATPDISRMLVRCTAGDNAGRVYRFDGSDWVEAPYFAFGNKGVPINFGGFFGGTPGTSSLIWETVVTDAVLLEDDFAGSRAYCRTAPVGGSISFDVEVNGVSVGSFDFATATSTATFTTTGSTVSLSAGDRIAVITPADLRTAADISWLFKGSKN
jgi:hypothetical protein